MIINSRGQLEFENCDINYRNFSGAISQYNPNGNRQFVVMLTEEEAEELSPLGWNVKMSAREVDGETVVNIFLPVTVNMRESEKDKERGFRPPNVVLISKKGRRRLTAETVGMLDMVYITNVDLIVNPYSWDVNGKQGIKAYMDSIYVTIRENRFEEKYSDLQYIDDGPVIEEEVVQ